MFFLDSLKKMSQDLNSSPSNDNFISKCSHFSTFSLPRNVLLMSTRFHQNLIHHQRISWQLSSLQRRNKNSERWNLLFSLKTYSAVLSSSPHSPSMASDKHFFMLSIKQHERIFLCFCTNIEESHRHDVTISNYASAVWCFRCCRVETCQALLQFLSPWLCFFNDFFSFPSNFVLLLWICCDRSWIFRTVFSVSFSRVTPW